MRHSVYKLHECYITVQAWEYSPFINILIQHPRLKLYVYIYIYVYIKLFYIHEGTKCRKTPFSVFFTITD